MEISNLKSFAQAEIELDRINVFIGENNTGKSTVLRAAYLLQPGSSQIRLGDIRLGAPNATVSYLLDEFDVDRYAPGVADKEPLQAARRDGRNFEASVTIHRATSGSSQHATHALTLNVPGVNGYGGQPNISPTEPGNFIYPYLSKRKVQSYDRGVDDARASQISGNLQNLVAKVARLTAPGQPGGEQFSNLCRDLLHLRLGAVPVENGQLVGFRVGHLGTITLEDMGEGVASILGLITDLCVADNQLFLIEEPENDIHPAGLKALLEAIIERSSSNQFIVSTHSNIVVKYLASAPNSRLFSIVQEMDDQGTPTSRILSIESSTDRSEALRNLGYDLHDFDLAEGWLILEESSAETFIREYLIPWFAPRLSRIRTVSCGGTGNVEPTFKEFSKLILFVHREEVLRDRAWVVVDGDPSGMATTEKLKAKYPNWPADRFLNWQHSQFEEYYPEKFSTQVSAALAESGESKRAAKDALRREVQEWCDSAPIEARAAFEQSASEVIAVLRSIESALFPDPAGASG